MSQTERIFHIARLLGNEVSKKFCVNGYTTPMSEYGHHQGNLGRALEGLQGS